MIQYSEIKSAALHSDVLSNFSSLKPSNAPLGVSLLSFHVGSCEWLRKKGFVRVLVQEILVRNRDILGHREADREVAAGGVAAVGVEAVG